MRARVCVFADTPSQTRWIGRRGGGGWGVTTRERSFKAPVAGSQFVGSYGLMPLGRQRDHRVTFIYAFLYAWYFEFSSKNRSKS